MLLNRHQSTTKKLSWTWQDAEYEVFTPHIERRVLKILPLEGRGVHNTDRRDKQNMGSLAGGGESKGFILVSHLHDAAECGDTTLARHLLEEGIDVRSSYDDGVTALHLASCKGHVSFVDLLLKSRCPPDIGTSIGLTPLHYAAAQGHTKVIEMLVSAGAHVNASCAKGRTPLFVAAENGTLESVKTLLKAGSQVNCASDLGMTPLSTASLHSHEEVVRVLLQHGASVNIADRHNNLPLHCAVRSGNTRLASAILAAGTERNILNKNFESPVHIAVRTGDSLMLELLIKEGCDVNYCEPVGNVTPLHMAINMQHSPALFSCLLNLLLQGGCILNWRAYSTLETPLYRSLDIDREDICKMLLSNGANPNLASPFDITALQKACRRGKTYLVNLMLNCGINWKRERWLQYYAAQQGEVTEFKEINKMLRRWKTEVVSLQAQCRIQIRRILEENLKQKLQYIPVPQKVRDYILLHDLL